MADKRFELVFDYIVEHEEVKQKIFFEGQIYYAFSLLVKLVGSAEKSTILIDNYADVDTLNILAKKINVKVCIYTMKQTKLTSADVKNFNRQFPKLEIKYTGAFHDHFLIVDGGQAYPHWCIIERCWEEVLCNKFDERWRGIMKYILYRLK